MAGSNGIEIISTAADGTQGDDDSGSDHGDSYYTGTDSFSISADGKTIAFMSDASNLVPGDADGLTDIFVKNLATGAITLASTVTGSAAGRSLYPSLSPDGTKVAFLTAPFLNGSPYGGSQIFVKDLVSGATTLVASDARDANNLLGNSNGPPTFSPDGTKIAFYSTAQLTSIATTRLGGLYVENLSTGAITLVSASAGGVGGNSYSSEPTFSLDGTKIAFTSQSTNLLPTMRTGQFNDTDVYVKDLVTGALTLVSANAAGERGSVQFYNLAESANPAFSPDGSKVAFQSAADNLTPDDHDGSTDVFIKDLTTGSITRVTALPNGVIQGGYGPAFSPDGTKVAFWTAAPNYTPYPHAVGSSVYIKDLVTGAFTLVSAPVDPTLPGDGNSVDPQFSKDGSEIVFFSGNDALVAADANGHKTDVFVQSLYETTSSAPTAVADSYTTKQGTPLTVAASAGLLANDTDADGKPLTAVLVADPAHGALSVNGDGSFTYTPEAGFRGSDSFTYRASDGALQSAAATVALTVTAVDHPVAAVGDNYSVSNASPSDDFTTTAATGVLANDTAPDGGLTALGVVVDGMIQTGFVRTAAGGSISLAPDGRFTYDQPFSSDDQGLIRFNGVDSFTYRVRDSDGSTADAKVTLVVGGGVNHAVVAIDDRYDISNSLPGVDFTTDTSNGVLANDYAADSGLVAFGIVVDGAVQTGQVRTAAGGHAQVLPDGRFVYDQPYSTDALGVIRYVGLDSFIYRVRDSDGSVADAKVTLVVGGGVDHPVFASADSYAVPNDFPSADFTTGTTSGLLANDYAADGGLVALGGVVDGVLQTGSVLTAAGGHVSIAADGRLTYDQPFSTDAQGLIRYKGLDSFTYRVRDSNGSTADAVVTLTVGSGVDHPVINGGDGAETLIGDDKGDQINGLGGADSVVGGAGNDTLDGGAGFDTLVGGKGDDTYYVDSGGDKVNEKPSGGTDTVYTSANWVVTPGSEIERLVATGTAQLQLYGNAHAMEIAGNNAVNRFDDGGAADTLAGAGGNDVYYVHNAGTQVVEAPGGGYDAVKTDLASYALTANVESLTYIGVDDFTGTGNNSSNVITGGGGNDTLDGGANAPGTNGDRLVGGLGDDTYVTHNAGDFVVELAGGGFDTVNTTLNSAVASPNIEVLNFIGSGTFVGFANAQGTAITGGAGSDTLHGGAAADTLDGGAGAGNDVLTGGKGADTFEVHADQGGVTRVTDFQPGVDHLTVQVDPGDIAVFLTRKDDFDQGDGGHPGDGYQYRYFFYDQATGKLYDEGQFFSVEDGQTFGGANHLIATFDGHPAIDAATFIGG